MKFPALETMMLLPLTRSAFEPAPLHAVIADVPVPMLAHFGRLMSGEGWHVDLARMCLDRLYAYERIAQAHTSARAPLRDAALDLFAAYDRHAEGRWLQ
ncbi:MAG: hypothetical protein Q8N44_12640 [Rubrivivax sp.]|nr:hypothetical protein [Rubrivivax sp.]